jgi:hypothetical protein
MVVVCAFISWVIAGFGWADQLGGGGIFWESVRCLSFLKDRQLAQRLDKILILSYGDKIIERTVMVAYELDVNLEHFLNFDGTRFDFETGHWIKFEVRRIEASKTRPNGLKYSLTLHRSDGVRIIGFDNAHAVRASNRGYKKTPVEYDHWHRTELDEGRPYRFRDLSQLFQDFFEAVDVAMKTEL